MIAIEISIGGEWLGYPLHLWDGENPDVRVMEYQKTSELKITWRKWRTK